MNLIQLHSKVHEVDTTDAFCAAVLNEYKDLLQGNLGNVPVVYKMRLDANVTPVVRPPRRIPLAMEASVKIELDRMVKIRAITPVSQPAKKRDGDIRICIDLRDLNKALKRPHHSIRTVEDVASPMTREVVSGKVLGFPT